ncbi:MAG: H-NS histone family protein [Sutterella sp.]|nr:H-NS histone family protein [Sutterella sp.]
MLRTSIFRTKTNRMEKKAAVQYVQRLVDFFGIQSTELIFRCEVRLRDRLHRAEPGYMNPETGEIWRGGGKAPRWIVECLQRGESIEKYRC